MSAFALRFLHRGTTPPPPPPPSVVYDTRFGTDATTAAATGWFTFGLHAGNRRVWVDGTRADDSGDGLSAATAKKTLEAGFTVFTNVSWTSGDQMMVANGSVYSTSSVYNGGAGGLLNRSGISATYPTAFLCYDRTDASNAAKYGKLTALNRPVIQILNQTLGTMFCNSGTDTGGSYAIQGIIFDCLNVDNASVAAYQGSQHSDICWQNCMFNTGELSFEGSIQYDVTGASYFQRINISKCAFSGPWTSSSNIAGCYFHAINGLWVQDNVWAHCGWKIGGTRDDGTLGGAAGTNHAHYFAAANKDGHFDRNFYVDSSYDGANMRGNCAATCITSLDEPVCGSIGAFSSTFHEAPDGVTITVDDWLIMGGAPMNAGTPAGYGPQNTNTLSGSYLRNIAALDNPYNTHAFITSYNNGGGTQNIVSITHSGTTATLTTDFAHGFVNGDHFSVAGASPTDYNVTRAVVTVVNSTTLTYTMATTPATNATTVGKYSPSMAPQIILLDKVHSYSYSGSWESLGVGATSLITNTYTNIISDQLASGGGNSTSTVGTFPSYKTRDQVVTAVLNGIGITPGATYYARKAQLVNAALTRADLPWSQWLIGVGLPAMSLTPTNSTPAYSTYTDTPQTIYATSLGTLTISTLNFVHGVSSSTLLSGVCANPVLTCADLPAGLTISGRTISGSATSAGTPTIHVVETTQDGGMTHTTAFTLSIT